MGLEYSRVAEILFDLLAACFGTAGDDHIGGNFAVVSFEKLDCPF